MSFSNIFNRAKNFLLDPQSEWKIIESEETDRNRLIKGYVFPFVIIIAICSFIGSSIFTLQLYSYSYIIIKTILTAAIVVGGVYLSSIIINELLVSFGTEKDLDNVFKLVAYSFTSYFISSCLVGILPDFPVLGLFGLHSVYLFWLGTTPILKTPDTNKVGFVIVSMLIIVGIYAILSLIVGTIMAGINYITQPTL